jgi:hypothetical protein
MISYAGMRKGTHLDTSMGILEVGIEAYILVCWVATSIVYTKITKPNQTRTVKIKALWKKYEAEQKQINKMNPSNLRKDGLQLTQLHRYSLR